MKFTKQASLVAGILVSGAIAYTPIASATTTNLNIVPLPYGTLINDAAILGGATFTDVWNFTVTANANLVSTEYSTTLQQDTEIPAVPIYNLPAYSSISNSGIELTSVALFRDSVTPGNLLQNAGLTVDALTPVSINPYLTDTTANYTAFLNNVPLTPGAYILEVQGMNVGTTTSGFNGTLSINATSILAAVPLPSATWLFLTGLLGFLGVTRRKSAYAY